MRLGDTSVGGASVELLDDEVVGADTCEREPDIVDAFILET